MTPVCVADTTAAIWCKFWNSPAPVRGMGHACTLSESMSIGFIWCGRGAGISYWGWVDGYDMSAVGPFHQSQFWELHDCLFMEAQSLVPSNSFVVSHWWQQKNDISGKSIQELWMYTFLPTEGNTFFCSFFQIFYVVLFCFVLNHY